MERIPILKQGKFLLVTIQVDIHDRLAIALQEDLAEQVAKLEAKGVIIDISSVIMVDSFMGHMLSCIAATTKALGAFTVVVGMQPEVAITIVELGLNLKGVLTALNIDQGVLLLNNLMSPSLARDHQ